MQGVVKYSNDDIKKVIFGLKMKEEHRNKIRHTLRDKKIEYYEAVKGKKEFSIEVVPVKD